MGLGVWHIIVSNYKEKGYVRNPFTLPRLKLQPQIALSCYKPYQPALKLASAKCLFSKTLNCSKQSFAD